MSNIPDGYRYTKDDEWIRIEGDEIVVGITDYAQDSLSDIVYLELPDGECAMQNSPGREEFFIEHYCAFSMAWFTAATASPSWAM